MTEIYDGLVYDYDEKKLFSLPPEFEGELMMIFGKDFVRDLLYTNIYYYGCGYYGFLPPDEEAEEDLKLILRKIFAKYRYRLGLYESAQMELSW